MAKLTPTEAAALKAEQNAIVDKYTESTPPLQPTIASLTATPSTVTLGQSVTLTATVANATAVTVNGASLSPPYFPYATTPTTTGSIPFDVVVTGQPGTVPAQASVTVQVNPAAGVILTSKGSAIGSYQLDNGVIELIDSAKIPAAIPWDVFVDSNLTLAHSMNGVEPQPYIPKIPGYKRMHVYGHGGNYNHAHPIPNIPDPMVASPSVMQVQPNLGTDPMLNVMKGFQTYPLRVGPRGRHMINSYTMWHGHTRIENGVIHTGMNVPYAIGIMMNGWVLLALRDGTILLDRKLTIKSYCYDFSFHLPRSDGFFWFVDTGVGELVKASRKDNTQEVWCTGLGRATSCREVNGVVYVTDDLNHKVWAVSSTSPNTKTVYRSMVAPFWADYTSDNRMVFATRQSFMYVEQGVGAGSALAQWTPGANSGPMFDHEKSFIQCDTDRNGTFGIKDSVIMVRAHGGGNLDLWRWGPSGTLWPQFNYSSLKNGLGVSTVGALVCCQDGIGHYPWFVFHHPDDGAIGVGGMANANPVLIAARHPTDTWMPMDYDVFNSKISAGRTMLMYGTTNSGQLHPTIPSLTTQVNGTGGGNLWAGDHLARMTPAEGLAFIRAGGIGSVPRTNYLGQNGHNVHLFLCVNSMEYVRRGKPYLDSLLAFYGTNP